jgi:Prokaryotic membrane lipoprotein lipid attachment site
MRIPIILAVAAFVLSGCNANQAVNPSSQTAKTWEGGRYVDDNPYNPISYAQNNTGHGGGGGGH